MKTCIRFRVPAILLAGISSVWLMTCTREPFQQNYLPVTPPAPTEGCAYYSGVYELPQSQSLQQLSEFLSSEHMEYDLDGWFFFGSVINGLNPADTGVFFIAVQRIEMEMNGFRAPMVPAIVGFNSKSLGKYEFRGLYTIDISPLMTVNTNPWEVILNSPLQIGPVITMRLVSGTMGAADAVYDLYANIPDTGGVYLTAGIRIRDRFGAVNQGDGPASFFAQFLTEEQRNLVMRSPDRRVSSYLEASSDPMSCQGSWYYSLPLLDLEELSIWRNGTLLSIGTRGLFWMDYVVQSYDKRAQEVFADASWSFFAIQFPGIDAAMMVIEINSSEGSLPIARLFGPKGGVTLNRANKPEYIWAVNDINIQATPERKWKSPRSHLIYNTQHRIRLMSDELPVDITLTMIRDDQEIYIDDNTIKYEGLARVEGTLGTQAVTGQAFVEIQPEGHLK